MESRTEGITAGLAAPPQLSRQLICLANWGRTTLPALRTASSEVQGDGQRKGLAAQQGRQGQCPTESASSSITPDLGTRYRANWVEGQGVDRTCHLAFCLPAGPQRAMRCVAISGPAIWEWNRVKSLEGWWGGSDESLRKGYCALRARANYWTGQENEGP